MNIIKQFKSFAFVRIHSILTSFVLSLCILFSILGVIGVALADAIASIIIVLGIFLQLFQVLIVLQLVNRKSDVGWVLHRLAYVTLLIMILSFLSIVGGTYLTSFFLFGKDVMGIVLIGYIVQISFGICFSSLSYHFLQIENVWNLNP